MYHVPQLIAVILKITFLLFFSFVLWLFCLCFPVFVYFEWIYDIRSKSSKPHSERRVIAEHFCCGNILPLIIKQEKLIHIYVLIQIHMWPIQRLEVDNKSKIWMRHKTF